MKKETNKRINELKPILWDEFKLMDFSKEKKEGKPRYLYK